MGDDKKKGKPSKAGRRKGQHEGFFLACEERKLRRVLRVNGPKAHVTLKDYFWDRRSGRSAKKQINFETRKGAAL